MCESVWMMCECECDDGDLVMIMLYDDGYMNTNVCRVSDLM